ncbi:MAG: hypothetical protein MI748_08770 [Opitutales bacterium]|nr:hypothetical protein [Opitutales bacterium]
MKRSGLSATTSFIFKDLKLLTIVFVALFFMVTTYIGLKEYFTLLPIFDTIAVLSSLDETYPISAWDYLLQDHNEHRVVLTKAAILIDFHLFGGLKIFSQTLIFLANGLALFLILRFYWKTTEPSRVIFTSSLVAIFLSLIQLRNFDSVFQLQFFLVNLLTISSFCLFLKYLQIREEQTRQALVYLLVAIGVACITAFNMANGLITPFILATTLLLLRRFAHFSFAFLAAVFTCIVYFTNYRVRNHVGASDLDLDLLLQIALYILHFVGNPFHLTLPNNLSVITISSIGLATAAYFFVATFFCKSNQTPQRIFSLMLITFAILSAATAAAGRVDQGYLQALTSRYASTGIIFWAGLIGLLFSERSDQRASSYFKVYRLFVGCLILVAATARQILVLPYCIEQGELRNIGLASLQAGFVDPHTIGKGSHLYPEHAIRILKEKKLAMFNPLIRAPFEKSYDLSNLGPDLPELNLLCAETYHIEDKGNEGTILYLSSSNQAFSPQQIIIVNDEGTVTGVGSIIRNKKHIPDYLKPGTQSYVWVVFFQESLLDLKTQTILSSKSSSLVNEGYSINFDQLIGYRILPELEIGEVVQADGVQISTEGSCFENGFFQNLGIQNPETHIIGTWDPILGDKNLGKISFTLNNQNTSSEIRPILLPVLFAPEKSQSHIKLVDSTNSSELNLIINDLPSHEWCYLNLSRLARAPFTVIIEDTGSDWGQWLAAGSPVFLADEEN